MPEDGGPVLVAGDEIMRDPTVSMVTSAVRPLRIVTFNSSHLKGFCGVQAFSDTLAAKLRGIGASTLLVDVEDASPLKLRKLVQAVAQQNPNVTSLQYPSETFGRGLLPHFYALRQRASPLVVTLHEFSQLHPLRRIGIMLLCLRASAVVSTTKSEGERLERWNPWLKGRTHVISIGNIMPAREWRPEDPPSVMYVGQVRPEKGLEDFFECADRLRGVRFAIIGSSVPKFGAYYDTVSAEAAKRGIPVMSGLSDDQVSDQLAKATIALLPFPDGATFRRSSLLAAAGCGVPIVTRTGPDTPNSLARVLAPARTVEQLADLVSSFLANSSLRQEAHLRSLELSRLAGWEPIGRDYLHVFETVAA